MRKQTKIFLFVGVPLFGFFFFMIVISFYLLSVLFFLAFLGIAIVSFRREDLPIRATKLAILLFIIFIILFPAFDWYSQISRRLARFTPIGEQVIDPAACANLETSFWLFANRSDMLNLDNITEFQAWSAGNVSKEVSFIQNYIYNRTNLRLKGTPGYNASYNGIITYTYDFFGEGRLDYDHIPTVAEVLGRGTDDCDGIAVVTCSLLTRLGYNAFIVESDYHWWTMVFDGWSATDINYLTGIRLNWWTSVGEPYYIFNRSLILFPRGVFIPAYDVMIDPYFYDDFYVEFLDGGYGVNPVLAWILLAGIFILLGFLINLYLRVPRRFKPKKKDLFSALIGGSGLLIAGIILYLTCTFGLGFIGNLITFIGFTTVILILDREYPEKMLKKIKKD